MLRSRKKSSSMSQAIIAAIAFQVAGHEPGAIARADRIFRVEGTIRFDPMLKRKPPARVRNFGPKTYQFFVAVSNECWIVHTRNPEGPYDHVETGSLGGEIYTCIAFHSKTAGGRSRNQSVALVEPGPVPHILQQSVNSVLWLAFASETYIAGAGEWLEPLFRYEAFGSDSQEIYNLGLTMKCDVRRATADSGLIERIVYWSDSKVRGWRQAEGFWLGPPEVIAMNPPYDQGFTNAIYQVLDTTSVGDQLIPASFEYTAFVPPKGGSSADELLAHNHFTGNVTNAVSKLRVASFLPAINGVAMARENRFRKEAQPTFAFNYFFTNRWLNDAEVRNLPEFTSQVALQTELVPQLAVAEAVTKRNRQGRKWPVLVVFGIVTAAFVILILWSLRK
ncbi:MAG: hypothetical protein ACI9VS_002241 [Candidatus Binatia bacterium]|jgi:hypothetical protein